MESNIGINVAFLRKFYMLSLAELADLLRIKMKELQNIEDGLPKIKVELIQKISAIFMCDLDDLLASDLSKSQKFQESRKSHPKFINHLLSSIYGILRNNTNGPQKP